MYILNTTREEELLIQDSLKKNLLTIKNRLNEITTFPGKDLIQKHISTLLTWLHEPTITKYFMDILSHFVDYIKDMEKVASINESQSVTRTLENFLNSQDLNYKMV